MNHCKLAYQMVSPTTQQLLSGVLWCASTPVLHSRGISELFRTWFACRRTTTRANGSKSSLYALLLCLLWRCDLTNIQWTMSLNFRANLNALTFPVFTLPVTLDTSPDDTAIFGSDTSDFSLVEGLSTFLLSDMACYTVRTLIIEIWYTFILFNN